MRLKSWTTGYLIIAVALVVTVMSTERSCYNVSECGINKSYYLQRFQRFLSAAEELRIPLDSKHWRHFDDQFVQLTESCFHYWEDELSQNERVRIAVLTSRYQYIRTGRRLLETSIIE